MGCYLKNKMGEYVKSIEEAHLELTTNINEAYDYERNPGGGDWSSKNEKIYIEFHYGDEFGDRVHTLETFYNW